jgi:predicted DNA-binding protein with PD1-like motif
MDLREEIEKLVAKHWVKAGVLVSLVGSLSKVVVRVADGKTTKEWNEPFEIVSATGTVSLNGCHIHLSVANTDAQVFGGHLKMGCVVATTVEVVLMVFEDVTYTREHDSTTLYDELVVI